MSLIPVELLFVVLGVLFVLSAFFSGSETALMALNHYRLNHRAEQGHYGARCARALLQHPDRLIGLILLGNNLVNILITQLASYLGYVYFQEIGVAIVTGFLTIAILVFAELAPKTLASMHAERVAYPAAIIYRFLMVVALPLVWLINRFANGLLRLAGVWREEASHALTGEELRNAVRESSGLLSGDHQKMLLGILDLEKITVNDVMIPRSEIVGIDLNEDWNEVLDQLHHPIYTRMPVYEGSIDHVGGMLHWRKVLPHILDEDLTADLIRETMRDPYFIPDGIRLHEQLYNFQQHKRRMGLVISEYGDVLGLVTLEDILESVIGTIALDPGQYDLDVYKVLEDGSMMVDASISVRELNGQLNSSFPLEGPRTLNGLILEHLEEIPAAGMCLMLNRYPMEVVKLDGTSVRTVRIYPRREPAPEEKESPHEH